MVQPRKIFLYFHIKSEIIQNKLEQIVAGLEDKAYSLLV